MSNFLIGLVIAVALLIFMIVKLKIHPVLTLFICGGVAGTIYGFGLIETTTLITEGFGSTLGSIGCTIIFGSIIACGIRDSDSVKSMVNFFIRLFRGKNPELMTALPGFIMSIPVFGDITMVLLAPIAAMIGKRDRKSMSSMMAFTGLATDLTHSIVPPTPGILAVTLLLGADLGMTIVWGIIVSFVAFILCYLLFRKQVAKEYIPPREDYVLGVEECDTGNYKDLLINEPGLPSVLSACSPILIPVILIGAASFTSMYLAEGNIIRTFLNIVGNRNIALFIGVLITFLIGLVHKDHVIANYRKYTKDEESSFSNIVLNKWVVEALNVALLPLMITAMGGGFSNVIKNYPNIEELGTLIAGTGLPTVLIPFLIGAVMMVAVGSRTTAGMTAAAVVSPMLLTLNLSPLAAVLLCGAGTMIGSHVNDSGFWVVTQLFNMDTKQGLKYKTVMGTVCGVIIFVMLAAINSVGLLG